MTRLKVLEKRQKIVENAKINDFMFISSLFDNSGNTEKAKGPQKIIEKTGMSK